MTVVPVALDRWAIVDLLGHRRVAGRVSEEMLAGVPTLRVDIPTPDGGWSTRNFGGQALYEVTWCSEEVARAVANRDPAHPVSPWTARSLGLLPAPPPPEPLELDEAAFLAEGSDPEDDEEEDGDGPAAPHVPASNAPHGELEF